MANSELIKLLQDLVRINSINPAYESGVVETQVQEFVKNFLLVNGIEVSEQEVLPGRPNVIAKLAGKNAARRIIFEAHCDTAGVKGMLISPFDPQIRNHRLYGRGSCDTKAGLAAMMLAIADLRRANQQPVSEVWVVSAVDEEHSYRGVWELRKNLNAAAAVVSEPTELKMAVASKGCLRWRIAIKGKAAHSSKPWLGINAIEHMAHVVRRLEEDNLRLREIHHPLLGSPTLNVGLIQGGTQVNVVPESCWIEVDRRLIPGEEPAAIFRGYRELLAGIQSERPSLDLSFEDPQIEDRPLETSPASSVARHAAEALKVAGLDESAIGVSFGSDASKLSSAGIPSIILGPGSIDQAHTAVEFVELEQLEKAFVVYRQIMRTFE